MKANRWWWINNNKKKTRSVAIPLIKNNVIKQMNWWMSLKEELFLLFSAFLCDIVKWKMNKGIKYVHIIHIEQYFNQKRYSGRCEMHNSWFWQLSFMYSFYSYVITPHKQKFKKVSYWSHHQVYFLIYVKMFAEWTTWTVFDGL